MRNKLFVIFRVFMTIFFISMQTARAKIILNDTGSWDGEIQALEEGFFWFWGSSAWTQTGANSGNKTINEFWDNYSPNISGVGFNNVAVEYRTCGLFANLGDCSHSIDFETRNAFVSESAAHLQNGNYVLLGGVIFGSGMTPISTTINASILNDQVTIGTSENAALSTVINSAQKVLTVAGIIPMVSYGVALDSLALSYLQDKIQAESTIFQIGRAEDFPVAANHAWTVYGSVTAEWKFTIVEMYADADQDGIAESIQTIYATFYDNIESHISTEIDPIDL